MSEVPQTPPEPPAPTSRRRFGCMQVLGIILIAVLLSAIATGVWIKYNVYASAFKTTTLSEKEEAAFSEKLARLQAAA